VVTYAKLEPEAVEGSPFRDLLFAYLVQSEESQIQAAMIGFSVALGNHPELLNADRDYFNFVAAYVSDVLVPYAERAAALQLAYLSMGGRIKCGRVLEAYAPELRKVQSAVVPDEAAASLILSDRNRSWNFFLALVSATAIVCCRQPKVAKLFGIKKSFFGGWRRAG
jgi:hypothetical protein